MGRALRQVTAGQLALIQMAFLNVQQAATMLEKAGAKKAAQAVRRAAKSAGGAWRHAQRAYYSRHPEGKEGR